MSGLHHQYKLSRTKVSLVARSMMLGLVFSLSLSSASTALADGEKRSRSEAVEIAKERSGSDGRVLSVKKENTKDGETVYAVKIINNGRVKVYSIPETP